MSNQILLISRRPEDKKFVETAAKTANLNLKIENEPSKLAQIFSEENLSAIFADVSDNENYAELEKTIENSVGLFSDKTSPNSFHFISSKDLDKAKDLILSPIFGHFIKRDFEDPEAEGSHYGRMMMNFGSKNLKGLDRIFTKSVKKKSIIFRQTSEKQKGVESVKSFLLASKFKDRMAIVVANAVDELLMNAMFDAPVDDSGKHVYTKLSRATDFELKGKALVELQMGFDGKYFAATVIDNFGSLNKSILMQHISKRFIEEEYQVKTTSAGAGIGLATVFRMGGSLSFSADISQKTEVSVFFKNTDNYRNFKTQFRFISTHFRY